MAVRRTREPIDIAFPSNPPKSDIGVVERGTTVKLTRLRSCRAPGFGGLREPPMRKARKTDCPGMLSRFIKLVAIVVLVFIILLSIVLEGRDFQFLCVAVGFTAVVFGFALFLHWYHFHDFYDYYYYYNEQHERAE
uniref:Uncharacterized protein n=1 Tax=Steinernema glaseri TaxID=37863 RepID=A0A1I7YYV6_9BILA